MILFDMGCWQVLFHLNTRINLTFIVKRNKSMTNTGQNNGMIHTNSKWKSAIKLSKFL